MVKSCMNCKHHSTTDVNGCSKGYVVEDLLIATHCKDYESALKVLLIKDCDDCPYHNSYYTYSIECVLQLDEFGLGRQLRYKEKGYGKTKAEMFSKCPLVNCHAEKVIGYYALLDEGLK